MKKTKKLIGIIIALIVIIGSMSFNDIAFGDKPEGNNGNNGNSGTIKLVEKEETNGNSNTPKFSDFDDVYLKIEGSDLSEGYYVFVTETSQGQGKENIVYGKSEDKVQFEPGKTKLTDIVSSIDVSEDKNANYKVILTSDPEGKKEVLSTKVFKIRVNDEEVEEDDEIEEDDEVEEDNEIEEDDRDNEVRELIEINEEVALAAPEITQQVAEQQTTQEEEQDEIVKEETVEEETVEEEAPQAGPVATLPKTGAASSLAYSGLGAILLGLGIFLKKKERK